MSAAPLDEGNTVGLIFPEPTHVTSAVIGTAEGQFRADKTIDGIRAEILPADVAWFNFLDIASKSGLRSAACRGYLITLAKRAAGAVQTE